MRNLLIITAILGLYSASARLELIDGFPEGCAFARMNEPLPYSFLGFGRIRIVGNSFVLRYRNQEAPGPFNIAQVAENVGLIGQNPDQNLSVNLMARTPVENFVAAQILDRSEFGLDPIVTCISPVFIGQIVVGRPIVFGQDYWVAYRRYKDYKWDARRLEQWRRWQERRKKDWLRDKEKRPKPKPDERGDGGRRPVIKPKPDRPVVRPKPGENGGGVRRPVVRPRPDEGDRGGRRPVIQPRPGENEIGGGGRRPTVRPKPDKGANGGRRPSIQPRQPRPGEEEERVKPGRRRPSRQEKAE